VSFLTEKVNTSDNDKLHKNMGDALFNLGNIDRAIYHYEHATKLNDKYDEAYYNLSAILYLQESYFNAKMNIQKALHYQPCNPVYLELSVAIGTRIKQNSGQ
jgi:tetratricopeptide (TPR) repeat protein